MAAFGRDFDAGRAAQRGAAIAVWAALQLDWACLSVQMRAEKARGTLRLLSGDPQWWRGAATAERAARGLDQARLQRADATRGSEKRSPPVLRPSASAAWRRRRSASRSTAWSGTPGRTKVTRGSKKRSPLALRRWTMAAVAVRAALQLARARGERAEATREIEKRPPPRERLGTGRRTQREVAGRWRRREMARTALLVEGDGRVQRSAAIAVRAAR